MERRRRQKTRKNKTIHYLVLILHDRRCKKSKLTNFWSVLDEGPEGQNRIQNSLQVLTNIEHLTLGFHQGLSRMKELGRWVLC